MKKKIQSSIIISTLISALFTSSFTRAQQPVKPKPIIAQYFGIWTEKGQSFEQKFRQDTPFDKLNRIYIAFARLVKMQDGHFTLDFDGDARNTQAIIDRARQVNPGADIFLVVGGDGMPDSFGGAVADPQFAQSVLKFLTRYGFDGLDVDWESGLDTEDLNSLMKNLYTTLHGNGLKLTLDVWPFLPPVYDIGVLRDNVDQINIMSYGLNLSLEYSANSYVQAGFPAEKIIGGVETETNYYAGVDSLGAEGSIAKKAQYAQSHGLAGMMGWRMDNDYAPKDDPAWPTYKGAVQLWDAMQ